MVIGRPTHRLALGLLAAGCLVFAQGAWLGLKADIAQVLLAQSWTRAIDGESASTPWPWADFRPVARLSVPSLGEHTIILSDGGSEALAFGPTLLGASARPGEPGVSVIAAHRDTHFAFLEAVRPGDLIVVEQAGQAPLRYRVTGMDVVDAARSGIEPGIGPARLPGPRGGPSQGRRSPPSCSATAKPLWAPSSWKPKPK